MPKAEKDPLLALDEAARRLRQEEEAARAVSLARARLVTAKGGRGAAAAFFAAAALQLDAQPCREIDTAATDGKRLLYNPEWFAALPREEAMGVLCHEVMHVILNHHGRQGARDPGLWNVAGDLAENFVIEEAGFALPRERLMPGEGSFAQLPRGLSAEDYYSKLPRDDKKPGGQPRGKGNDPGRCGGVVPAGDGGPAAQRQAEAEARALAARCRNAAKCRGTLPGGIARLVDERLAPKADWRELLREFVSRAAKNNYQWVPPSRRYLAAGLCLPGLKSEELGEVACLVDTSGSVGPRQLARFAAELEGILSAYDCRLTVLYHDTRVQHKQEWKSSDGPLAMEARGGGGTSHRPAFAELEKSEKEWACVVGLTDLESDLEGMAEPPWPVLWAAVGQKQSAPWGRVVKVDDDD